MFTLAAPIMHLNADFKGQLEAARAQQAAKSK